MRSAPFGSRPTTRLTKRIHVAGAAYHAAGSNQKSLRLTIPGLKYNDHFKLRDLSPRGCPMTPPWGDIGNSRDQGPA